MSKFEASSTSLLEIKQFKHTFMAKIGHILTMVMTMVRNLEPVSILELADRS